jgi:LGFP repeat/Calcineurin-like phosphoesterase
MASEIDEKVAALTANGIDVGRPLGNETDAGFGGSFRDFEHARIYWHPVMGQDANEVHGGILSRYLADGGHSHDGGGERRYGFPMSDERVTQDGLHPVSYFEFGAIVWRNLAGPIWGPFYQYWRTHGSELGDLGYPLSEIETVPGGRAQIYERGFLMDAGLPPLKSARYIGPMLGQPALIAASAGQHQIPLYATNVDDIQGSSTPAAAMDGRLFLREVRASGQPRAEVPLSIVSTRNASGLILHGRADRGLTEGMLYDLCFRRADSASATLATHAVYAKTDWTHFGMAHVTDMHVARRNDHIPRSFPTRIADYNNFNDVFRDFIRTANRLHDAGTLDAVWATGDLVDYIYEDGDNENGPGNFRLLEELLLGLSGYPERVEPVEELRVPIFTGLGNHDYRLHPYALAFALDLSLLGYHDVLQFGSFNISRADADTAWGVDLPHPQGLGTTRSWQILSASDAAPSAEVSQGMKDRTNYYFRTINRDNNYVVRAGIHRLVMLDSRWDAGITTGFWEAVWVKALGQGSKAQRSFLGNGPASTGPTPADVELLRTAVAEATAQSIVLLGIHAPLVDIENHEYAHYFRETEHRNTPADEIRAFGYEYMPVPSAATAPFLTGELDAIISSWLTIGQDFFKEGSREPLLDTNVSLDQGDTLLDICLGSAGRPVDIVLEGHVHRNAEIGVGNNPAGGHRYFHDYYTENPAEYYASQQRAGYIYQRDEVRVRVGRVTAVQGPYPVQQPGFETFREVAVPPYADTLDSVEARGEDLQDWWHDHRPLLIQTGALGPLEATQKSEAGMKPHVSFQGFRVLHIADNTVRKIRYVRTPEFRDPTQPLSWEPPAIWDPRDVRPRPPRPHIP